MSARFPSLPVLDADKEASVLAKLFLVLRPARLPRIHAARMTRPAPAAAAGSGKCPSRMIGRPLTNDH